SEAYLNRTPLSYEYDGDNHLLSVYHEDGKPIPQGFYNLTFVYKGSIKVEPENGLWKASLPDGNSTAEE
ncbi:hypothetical protein, partial [Enterobacter cloacae complex sp. 2DZ2F20B]|uniref:hypothetical protein n=1 Tax=Enterobacter cloacae complex sp. 2DZ2F20B TaxID=2511993 RepID=UPI001024B120